MTTDRANRVKNELLKRYLTNQLEKIENPEDLDSKIFEPQLYLKNLLNTLNLPQLLEKDVELKKEIKSLDSNMKSLVYDNYTKFISASDTIRKMKSNIENMESEMNQLAQTIQKITTSSEKIGDSLQSKREKIEQLSGVHQLLQKLEFLVELPAMLKRSLNMEAYSEAIQHYKKTRSILEKYDYLPSFARIKQQCDEIMDNLKLLLKQKCKNSESSSEISEFIGYLLDLNESSGVLRNEYLEGRIKYLTGNVQRVSSDESPPLEFTKLLNRSFFPVFLSFTNSYYLLFMKRENSAEEVSAATKQLQDVTNQLFITYLNILESRLLKSDANLSLSALEQVHENSELVCRTLENPEIAAILSIKSRTRAIIDTIIDTHIQNYFSRTTVRVSEYIEKLEATGDVNDESSVSSTVSGIIQVLSDFASELNVFLDATRREFLIDKRSIFLAKVQVKFEHIFGSMVQSLLDRSNGPAGQNFDNNKMTLVLLLAVVTKQLDREILVSLKKKIHWKEDGLDIFQEDFTKHKLNAAANQLLSLYVRLQGQKIGQMIRKAIETPNWLNKPEPRDVDMVIEMIIDEVIQINAQLKYIFLYGPSLKERKNSLGPKHFSRFGTGLFEKKVQIFGDVEFDHHAIITAIIKICLKTFLECVRFKTFGTNGFQQVQVNIHLMRVLLKEFVEDESLLNMMLDEILVSSSERCIKPIPMDNNIIAKICETKIEKRKTLQQKSV